MATVKITFTGICLFLPDATPPRVIIGKTPQKLPCFDVPDFAIPAHYPYLTYKQNQLTSGKTVLKTGNGEEAVLLSGYVRISGNIVDSTLQFPGGSTTLPNIIKTIDVAPAYTPLPTVQENDITKILPQYVAARIDLPNGIIDPPEQSKSYWHFFPVKGKPVRIKVAQAVCLTLTVSDDTVKVTEQPFGIGTSATDVVNLKSSTGAPIELRFGNSSEPDIVPLILQTKPPVGPDFDFELQWNLFDRHGDLECPPVSFNEGVFSNGGFVTLGGGNCPPTQWP